MGKAVRILVYVVAALFISSGVWMAVDGRVGAGLVGAGIGAFLLFVVGVDAFERKHPLPPLPAGSRPSLLSFARRYWNNYPNWRGRLVAVVLVGLALLSLASGLLKLAGSAHV